MGLASRSWSSCLAVVPEPTREWKPEMAPQAMVTNRAGNIVPSLVMGSLKAVKAGISMWAASAPVRPAPMTPTAAITIMP